MIDKETLRMLMLPKDKRPKKKKAPNYKKGFALVRTEQGLEKVPLSQVSYSIGKFEGKQGTTKRSSKGRTSILPNGKRYYNGLLERDIVAYLSK